MPHTAWRPWIASLAMEPRSSTARVSPAARQRRDDRNSLEHAVCHLLGTYPTLWRRQFGLIGGALPWALRSRCFPGHDFLPQLISVVERSDMTRRKGGRLSLHYTTKGKIYLSVRAIIFPVQPECMPICSGWAQRGRLAEGVSFIYYPEVSKA